MDNSILEHVGKRIKLYRKAKGITVEELAAQISKSKSTVSKYETGSISIDVATLFEIASALEVEPIRLLDYSLPQKSNRRISKNPFGDAELLYFYHMQGTTIYPSVIKLMDNPHTGNVDATLFYKVEDLEQFERCDCLYHGHMRSHDTILCFTFENYYNAVENILINFMVPMKKISHLVGMMSGLYSNTFSPVGCKVIVSKTPMRPDESLRELLTISKDTFKDMKSRNMLFV